MAYKLGGTGSNTSPGTFSQRVSTQWNRFAEGQKLFNKKPVISDRTKQYFSNFASGTKVYGPASAARNLIRGIGSTLSSAASYAASKASKK